MDLKIVISDPKTGKSYQKEIGEDKASQIRNLNIGDELTGEAVGLPGYTLSITGGSVNTGTPMRKGIPGSAKKMALLTDRGVGYKPKRDERKRKRVAGEQISQDTVQVNTKIVKEGKKRLDALLGSGETPADSGGDQPTDQASTKEKDPEPKVEEATSEAEKTTEPTEKATPEKTDEGKGEDPADEKGEAKEEK